MSHFKAKMHQIRFLACVCPSLGWSLTRVTRQFLRLYLIISDIGEIMQMNIIQNNEVFVVES